MAEENKAILESANAAVRAGDHEGFLAHFPEDVVWTFVGDQTLNGKAALRRYVEATYAEPPDFTVERLVAEGDVVAATGVIRLKDASGEVVPYEYCDVWRVRDGKLAELRAYVVAV